MLSTVKPNGQEGVIETGRSKVNMETQQTVVPVKIIDVLKLVKDDSTLKWIAYDDGRVEVKKIRLTEEEPQ